MRADFERIFRETGLSLECMDLCDRRGGADIVSQLSQYDVVILGGGHVPTQKAFFDEIGLRDALQEWDGIVMGISAGSMNCADVVYAQPEMPGEASDSSYQKFIRGLGLTDINVLPHYQAVKDDRVDGLRLMEDITYPDSFGRTFYAIVDGSYVLQTEDRKEIRGPFYRALTAYDVEDVLLTKVQAFLQALEEDIVGQSSKIDVISGQVDKINESKMYRTELVTEGVSIFREKTQRSLVRCKVYSWDNEITDTLPASAFNWHRNSGNVESDAAWDAMHTGMKTINVSTEDVTDNASFFCEVTI